MRIKALLIIGLLALTFLPVHAAFEVTPDGVVFTYVDENAGSVAIAGEFNNWNTGATLMEKKEGVWTVTVELPPGKHEYKFVVDGQWMADPDNPVTSGAYGNSLVEIGTGGGEVKHAATSNTAFSPKILLGGRFIGLYKSATNEGRGDQFELTRPTMDIDLDWSIRVNEVTDVHLLTTINNENEATETDFWRTNMRFDRGSIKLHTDEIEGMLYDNESAGRWDDPLELVGGIGIYDHDFGFRQQGAIASTWYRDLGLTLLYSDDFENGGTTTPGIDSVSAAETGTVFDSSATGFRFSLGDVVTYNADIIDNDKDIFAARLKLPYDDFTFGSSFRYDRGHNPGSLSIIDAAEGDTVGTRRDYAKTVEQWTAWGGDVSYGGEEVPYRLRFEYLRGSAHVAGRDGTVTDVVLRTSGEVDPFLQETTYDAEIVSTSGQLLIEGADFDLDNSNRFFVGGEWRSDEGRRTLALSWELETHEQTFYATGIHGDIDNSVNLIRFDYHKEYEAWHDLRVGLAGDFFSFDYDDRTPWENQLWFDTRNFWLEHAEHEVSFDRMTLLGGRDATILRPEISFDVWEARDVRFTYLGQIAGVTGNDPKYVETLLQLLSRPYKSFRLYSDTRLVKYNDPVLDLFSSYWSTFFEVAYEFGAGLELAFSYGVDPYVIDETTNEYGYIGRDEFLFDLGANGDAARKDFTNLGSLIPQAEQALEDEERFQVEGIVRF